MPDSKAQQAKAFFRALCELDPENPFGERAELLEAGVALSTVDSLYPISFDALVPGIIRHYTRASTAHLNEALVSELTSQRNVHAALKDALPEAIKVRWLTEHPLNAALSPAAWDLLGELRNYGGRTITSSSSWYSYIAVLWSSWWLMHRRSALHRELQFRVDDCMLWVECNMLPNLIDDSKSASNSVIS